MQRCAAPSKPFAATPMPCFVCSNELWYSYTRVALSAGWPLAPHSGAAVVTGLPVQHADSYAAFKCAWATTQARVCPPCVALTLPACICCVAVLRAYHGPVCAAAPHVMR